jgi:hypothetical protein
MLRPYKTLYSVPTLGGGWDSVVRIATRYGPDCSGFESLWVEIFPSVQTGPESIQPPVQRVSGLFPEEKTAGAWP